MACQTASAIFLQFGRSARQMRNYLAFMPLLFTAPAHRDRPLSALHIRLIAQTGAQRKPSYSGPLRVPYTHDASPGMLPDRL